MQSEAARKRAEYIEKRKVSNIFFHLYGVLLASQPSGAVQSSKEVNRTKSDVVAKPVSTSNSMSEEEKRAQFLASWKVQLAC